MSTFKAALRVALAHPVYILIYTVFIAFMGVFTSVGASAASADSYEPYQANVAVVDRDGSVVSRGLVEQLARRYSVVDVVDDAFALQDALAQNVADCVLIVPAGYGDGLIAAARSGGEAPNLQEAYGSDLQAASLVCAQAQRLCSLVSTAAALEPEASPEAVMARASKAAEHEASVSVRASGGDASASAGELLQYLRFDGYAITSSVIVCCGLVISAMAEERVSARVAASPLSGLRRGLATFAACAVLTACVWAITCGIGLVAFAGEASTLAVGQLALALLSMLVFSLVPMGIAFLLSQLGAREQALNAFGNILGMVMTFLGGAWVPLSIMGAEVRGLARLVPSYWTNEALASVLSGPLTASSMQAALVGIGITALFALALAALGLAVGSARARRRLA